MNYDFRDKFDRRRAINYVNMLLRKQRPNVEIVDRSGRTLNQNSYMHILVRIVASYTGETEYYAKQIYFKEMANPGIFWTVTKDSLTGETIKRLRSSTELSIPEMRMAISSFRQWTLDASDGKLVLPDAIIKDDGTVEFNSEEERIGFEKAEIEASKNEFNL